MNFLESRIIGTGACARARVHVSRTVAFDGTAYVIYANYVCRVAAIMIAARILIKQHERAKVVQIVT